MHTQKLGFILILASCLFNNISSSPQRQIKENTEPPKPSHSSTAINAIPSLGANKTNLVFKSGPRCSASFLPPVMQAIAYYVELIQYEPLHSTTIEPPFTLEPISTTSTSTWNPWSTTSASTTTWKPWTTSTTTTTPKPSTTWWSPPSTTKYTTTHRPSTVWWTPPSTTTTTRAPTTTSWWQKPSTTVINKIPFSTPPTQRPTSTTPTWWNQETTPNHRPAIYSPINAFSTNFDDFYDKPHNNQPLGPPKKPSRKPSMVGDLSVLSVASYPYFDFFVKPSSKIFTKKPEYEFLHQLPAELLQDIESEPFDLPKVSDQDNVDEFRRTYDDFHSRIRVFAPQVGKKRIPPTKTYVQMLMIYDLYKREAKRLALSEFEGYCPDFLERLKKTSSGSAERQLYILMFELLEQQVIDANDVKTRMADIMLDLANPYSVTAKALHVLKPLSFEP